MKVPGNVHKDLLYNFRVGATEICVALQRLLGKAFSLATGSNDGVSELL